MEDDVARSLKNDLARAADFLERTHTPIPADAVVAQASARAESQRRRAVAARMIILSVVLIVATTIGLSMRDDATKHEGASLGKSSVPASLKPASSSCRLPFEPIPPPDGLSVQLRVVEPTPDSDYFQFVIEISNTSSRAISHTRGYQAVDVWLASEDRVVWLWSQGKVVPALGVQEDFEAGETTKRTVTWRGENCLDEKKPLPPGRYTARALWLTKQGDERNYVRKGWWSNPAEVVVAPG